MLRAPGWRQFQQPAVDRVPSQLAAKPSAWPICTGKSKHARRVFFVHSNMSQTWAVRRMWQGTYHEPRMPERVVNAINI